MRLFEHDFRLDRLVEWQDKGYIHNLTRRYYIFNDVREKLDEQMRYFISNEIYSPSYVSLESALAFYHLIPEGVYLTTSVSSRKTEEIQTPVGNFRYRSIKPSMMVGYTLLPYGEYTIRMASLEKAIVDFLYLHNELHTEGAIHELRINTHELFSTFCEEDFWKWVAICENKALEQRARLFLEYCRNPTYAQY